MGPSVTPGTMEEVASAVAGAPRIRVRGGGSKSALADTPADAVLIDMRRLSGIVEYDPGEYTFTALAGTPVAEVRRRLGQHGQTLPFDPPLEACGATLGGTVAAGLSGSGRYRYGGVRDFILGVRFVDGEGRLVRGGGKVVKNAAGFDLPKLMVGALGRLGVLVELTFKVFPRPEAQGTLRLAGLDLADAVALLTRLTRSSWDIAAVDLVADGPRSSTVVIRLAGLAVALGERLERLRGEVGHGDLLLDGEDEILWREAREFSWRPADAVLVKVPLTPGRIAAADPAFAEAGPVRRYVAGGQLAWLAWTGTIDALDARLRALGLGGLVVIGDTGGRSPLIGALDGGAFARRVKQAMDPANRFGDLP